MPKFKVVLTYADVEVTEVDAENEQEALHTVVNSNDNSQIRKCNLLDYDVYEVE